MRIARALFATVAVAAGASCHAALPQQPSTYRDPSAVAKAGDDGSLGASPRVAFALAEEPPLGLTASDGTGLRLAKLEAEAVVDGPLAFTELRLTFENPEPRVLEGTFRIALPEGASLGRFAMKIGGEWQEGEVVELSAARRAYEDFLHRKQDPALMEKAAGNEFSARVFPIPARGTKEIVVAYAHEVSDGRYTLPLKGLPELGALDVSAHVVGRKKGPAPLSSRGVAPSADYVADVRPDAADPSAKAPVSGVRSGELAILRVRPDTSARPEPLGSALVLVDTSASRVLGFEGEVKLVDRLVGRIAEGDGSVVVAAFDQSVAPIFEGKAAQFGERDRARLLERGALGASDLERALAWAKERARAASAKRVILVTDGVATAGSADAKKLASAVAALKDAGIDRLDAVAVGGIRDDAALTRLVRGNLPRDGVVALAEGDGANVLRRLGEATRSGVSVKVEGASWAWPQRLDGVQAGDTYTVYAEVPARDPVKVSIDGAQAKLVEVRPTERPLAERVIAQAKVNAMLEREATTKDDLKKAITSIAVRHRILTPYTAMLVLETEADYARFHIDRRSLTDVLAIEGGGVKRVHRVLRALPPTTVATTEDELAPQDATVRTKDKGESAKKSDAKSEPAKPRERLALADSAQPAPEAPRPAAKVASGAGAPIPTLHAPSPPPPPPDARPAPRPRPAREEAEPQAEGGLRAERLPRVRPGPANGPAHAPRSRAFDDDAASDEEETDSGKPPYEGRFASVMEAIRSGRADEGLAAARAWRAEAPGDVLALVAIGESAEAQGHVELASRAYGSILDLFPNRADLRRFAGERLDRIAQRDGAALDLAIDTYTKAVADRPDHPAGHRLLAYALVRKKAYEKAFAAIAVGRGRGYEVDRFRGVDQILAEDVGLIGAAWARAEPSRRVEIERRVREAGGRVESEPSLRFVLVWETDANDVDFHIRDVRRGHAFFSQKHLRSGGDLYEDVTTGYGPECFTIRLPKERRAAPYRLAAHYYSRGPMGYGMGKLEVIEHDGKGNLTFQERPFVVMVDHAFVDLGTVE